MWKWDGYFAFNAKMYMNIKMKKQICKNCLCHCFMRNTPFREV